MIASVIALFGEAEKGHLDTAYYCKNLEQLFEYLGEPPQDAKGLFFAIQSLLHGKPLVYFRVEEEGVSMRDYVYGMRLLKDPDFPIGPLNALYLPGVGSQELLEEGFSVCRQQKSLLIMDEADFYDYLTDKPTCTTR